MRIRSLAMRCRLCIALVVSVLAPLTGVLAPDLEASFLPVYCARMGACPGGSAGRSDGGSDGAVCAFSMTLS